jgi:hypothetical protein
MRRVQGTRRDIPEFQACFKAKPDPMIKRRGEEPPYFR